ncbi:hypothetical protein Pla108_18330 [Botrimarina colliarenosi]|uniref:DUF6298 domain-containing protein n=1 Tax=Botrimarina colliarenosi TaxID=2528001 RepID=A0A5C6AF38_9BACT|nr:DUF6298 domain-containing protein [Botrimarina colliarenosi]TWT97681.1 hypothetical protein Pla108_18330 [Botrimarina colliarenosi]
MPLLTRTLLIALLLSGAARGASPPVHAGPHGKLVYEPNERGDRVPDFSSCGYAGADRAIPVTPVRVVVNVIEGDNGRRIQAAIDYVSTLPVDEAGLRGAVLLAEGTHDVAGQLQITASGVVLQGAGADRTRLVATGEGRRPLIRIEPATSLRLATAEPIPVTDDYVPVGAVDLVLDAEHGLKDGDAVVVTRPSTEAWIAALGAKTDGVGWRAGRTDIRWERRVVAVEGGTITLDAPLTTSLDKRFGGGAVAKVTANKRLREVGVQDLTLVSKTTSENPLDEEHSWYGVVANDAQDLWVLRTRFVGFAGGAVLLREGVRGATVEDCLSLAPVSELGGYRRHSFFTQGQQTLFLRCWAEEGLHDFSVGHCAAGPNAFVNCYASNTHGDSGPLESWASGVLYDNVRIDGGNLALVNRWLDPPGAGWSAANCVAWQCQAAQLHCFSPPTAQNWALAFWAQPVGDGEFHGLSDFYKPISLFKAQVAERLGEAAAERVGPFLLDPIASTRPSVREAVGFVGMSNAPAKTLRDLIDERLKDSTSPSTPSTPAGLGFDRVVGALPSQEATPASHPMKIVNGWITIDGQVATGGTMNPTWWRGVIRPNDAPEFGPSISRYAPGRYGTGLTDELVDVADGMGRAGTVAYDHHYGLWYDRRRDDHLMVRRATGAVAPPFFEQPFARSGEGRAWDGLSRYDLTKFNAWYWDRLRDFTELCDQRGLVFMHQCYFQHNILEAGGHWADCPWRSVNNVNATPFSEPPPYVGDKRIFIAHQFYDPANAKLRELHRGYLNQCVDSFADRSNVLQMTSAEYTGPLEFTQFWLDTVDSRRDATDAPALVAISAPKDVQDALLADPVRRDAIDVIDIRYWSYARNGKLYAPPGGANMAPRQHQRVSSVSSGDFASVARSVREYREAFPTKPVTFYADHSYRTPRDGWAVLMGGGSLANVPKLSVELKRSLVTMAPTWSEGDALMRLADGEGLELCYAIEEGTTLPIRTPSRVRWIDPASGQVTGEVTVAAGNTLTMAQRVAWVTPSE